MKKRLLHVLTLGVAIFATLVLTAPSPALAQSITLSAVSGAVGTTISVTGSGVDRRRWAQFTVATAKTFTSSEILGLSPATGFAASAGVYDIMLRYKEA